MWLWDAVTRVSYELLHEIHAGGEGRTWRARQVGLSNRELPVAVKILSRAEYFNRNLNTSEVYELWKWQEEIIRYFNDHGFVPIQAVFWTAAAPGRPAPPESMLGLPAVVTAWVEGEGLRAWSQHVEDPLDRLAVLQVCSVALDRFHSKMGYVHRDLNPNNILVASDGIAEIIDYGLLRDASIARSGSRPIGTPSYLAPELLNDEPYSAASDRYSFAAILYHQLLREDPPEVGTRRRQAVVAARLADHGYRNVASLIVGWLNDDPGARPAVRGAADMLERVMRGVLVNATPTTTIREPLRSMARNGLATEPAPGGTTEAMTGAADLGLAGTAALQAQLQLRRALLPAAAAFVLVLASFVLTHLLTR